MTEEKKKILVVDDFPDIFTLVEASFAGGDYTLINAMDGEEAISLAIKENPSLILLDIDIPKKDGFEVCRILRATPGFADTPIIMLTSLSGKQNMEKGFQLGADDYITKPFSLSQIRSRVNTWLIRKGHHISGHSGEEIQGDSMEKPPL